MISVKMKTAQTHLTFLEQWDVISISNWGEMNDVTMRFRSVQAEELIDILKKFLEKKNG